MQPFFTVGHSNLGLEAFIDLLRGPGVECLVDIRKMPRSRANPQFNQDTLPAALAAHGIDYAYLAALGGFRGRVDVPAQVNGLWRNASFHRYADYALSAEFRDGLAQLLERGRRQRCALMCAEAVWWRCHRRIVTDHLIAAGCEVFHLMAAGRIEPAKLTPGAVVGRDGSVTYPAPALDPAA